MDSTLSIATIRSLVIDMINKANSGHPGMAIGSAPALYTLWTKELRVFADQPKWQNRDRFVLASGHACALLYSLLHLSGYDLSMEDLKQFRQWESKTPGHPEMRITEGVDASSGPLGQGLPTAVGMAIAEKFLAEKFNKDGFDVVDHYTYVLCGDGDMQEGVTYEGSSLAGHLALGKLIVIYDANNVTLDGPLSYSFSENVKKRYEAMNWQVIEVADGEDINAISKAIKKAKREKFKPSLIINHTVIGRGSAKEGTNAVHGAPLGAEDGKRAKQSYGFDYDEEFFVPEEVYDDFKKNVYTRSKRAFNKWFKMMSRYREEYPEDYKAYEAAISGRYYLDIKPLLDQFQPGMSEATRNTSLTCIQEVAKQLPTFISGTADLASSTKTTIKGEERFSPENYTGRNMYFGIREFAMVCIMNGITLHKGIKIAAGGFLVFSDYFKAGLRMACLQELPIILPLSHDSIAVGEDGPTHQPVEQLASLRSMLDLLVIRPADANEMACAWKIAVESQSTPTALILTRQNVENCTNAAYEDVIRGAYIVSPEQDELDGIIIATGSEVELALKTQKELFALGCKGVRVVSMPCTELFDAQNSEYKDYILPKSCRRRMSIEMASDFGWYKYIGLDGYAMCVNTFGSSAPASRVIPEYGFTVENAVQNYLKLCDE